MKSLEAIAITSLSHESEEAKNLVGIHSQNPNTATVGIGVVTASKGSVQKRINADGSKDSSHSLSVTRGTFENRTISGLQGLADVIANLKSNQALTLGIAGKDGALNLYTDAVYQALSDKSNAIARTKECVQWPSGAHFLVFDHDPEPGTADVSADELWERLIRVMPELEGIGRLVTTSTSSGIYDKATGECIRPENGHHTYIQVQGDVQSFVETLKARCWLKGEAFYKLGAPNARTGTQAALERFLVDVAVFSPERLIYEAGALLPDELEQRRSAPRVVEGGVLELDAIADADTEKAESLKAKAAKRTRAKQVKQATKALEIGGVKGAEIEARRRINAVNLAHLGAEHVLEIATGGTLKVKDIGAEHDGLLLRDPQEPTYRNGAQVAKLHWNDDRPWKIYSQAHGGITYGLMPFDVSDISNGDNVVAIESYKDKRNRESYEKIARFLGDSTIANGLTKENAKDVLFPKLKKALGYEIEGGIRTGFVEPMEGRGLKVIDASKGTGKTKGAIIAEIKVALAQKKEENVLIFVPTRALARTLAGEINSAIAADTATTHQNDNWAAFRVVVSCPESAYKFGGVEFPTVIIDEANECFQRVQAGNLGKAPARSLFCFTNALEAAKTVIIATDKMYQPTLDAAKRAGGFSTADIQRVQRPQTPMSIKLHPSKESWIAGIISAIEAGKRVAIPMGAQGQGRALDRLLRKRFLNKKGIVMDGRATMESRRTAFFDSPDAFLNEHRPDWFIFSPVANSGVSVDGRHFDIQYEYIQPSEGAQSAAQRGERIRSAIGRDRAITERHIFFSMHGAPTLEAYPDALMPQYWDGVLADEKKRKRGPAAAMAKALGLNEQSAMMDNDLSRVAVDEKRPELSRFHALNSFDVMFKFELLMDEWKAYGWNVSDADIADESLCEDIKQELRRVQIGLFKTEGRTLKSARVRFEEEIDDISNPFQAARAHKSHIERLIGAEFAGKQDANFYTAWFSGASDDPNLKTVVRGRLLHMAINESERFQTLNYVQAFKAVSLKPGFLNDLTPLPDLPASPSDITLIAKLSKCQPLIDIVSGRTEQWSNYSAEAIEVKTFLIKHARFIASHTAHSRLPGGMQFNEKMSAAQCLKNVLGIVGTETKKARAGAGKRWNIHSILSSVELVEQLQTAKAASNELAAFKAATRLQRAQTRLSIDVAIDAQLLAGLNRWAESQDAVSAHIEELKARHANSLDTTTSNERDDRKKRLIQTTLEDISGCGWDLPTRMGTESA